jgi:hypothetical protein
MMMMKKKVELNICHIWCLFRISPNVSICLASSVGWLVWRVDYYQQNLHLWKTMPFHAYACNIKKLGNVSMLKKRLRIK